MTHTQQPLQLLCNKHAGVSADTHTPRTLIAVPVLCVAGFKGVPPLDVVLVLSQAKALGQWVWLRVRACVCMCV